MEGKESIAQQIAIISANNSPRLQYALDWIGSVFRISFTVDNVEKTNVPSIYYDSTSNGISIPSAGLLFQTDITKQQIETGEWGNIPTLFAQEGHTIPFDIFSAIFYLLTRYEEYLPYTPDKHNRYPHTEGIMHQHGWMQRPLIDEWLAQFAQLLKSGLGINVQQQHFKFIPSYDIDIAWAFRHKGFKRQTGALAKNILTGNLKEVATQLSVLTGKTSDPYNSFNWLQALHQQYNQDALFFILAALNTGPFDKNISPLHPQMQLLIKSLHTYGNIGMHPSYNSNSQKIFEEEKKTLETVLQEQIRISRQHYIRFRLPHTYRDLIAHGITDDYSMGWTDTIGFRAGTGHNFKWYDVEREEQTALIVHPFCFMDTAARFGMNLNATEAFRLLYKMKSSLEETGSTLTTIFHNFSLGIDKGWIGWSEAYSNLFKSTASI